MTVSTAVRTASAGLVAAGLLIVPAPASAGTTAQGPEGQTLTVSKTTSLSPAGETVTVEGSGYDENKGIYVAFCVDNGPDALPTPCGGGADTTGSLGASHWISSNPPSYGEGLAVPYEEDGSFSVTLNIQAQLNGDVDCTQQACAVVTRADHTRSSDRTQDVRVPVSFGGSTDGAGAPGGSESDGSDGGESGGSGDTEDPGRPDGGTPTTTTPDSAGAAVTSPGSTPTADALAANRTSGSDSASRWWYVSTGALVVALLGLLIAGRVTRRRAARRQPATPPDAGPS